MRPRSIIQGIKNLVYWFKVIWSDREWDEYFMLNIMYHKLQAMEKYFANDANFVGAEREASNIHKAILIIDRLRKDDYILSHNIPFNRAAGYAYESYMIKQDLNYLNTIFTKYLDHWWD